jgi:hypothetical protein
MMLGALFFMIPARWAAAADAASPAGVASLPAGVESSSHPGQDSRSSAAPARPGTVDPIGPSPGTGPEPRLVINPLTIEGAAFYDAVGRPDLADEYRARHGWAVASRVVGGLSLGLGAAAWLVAKTFESTTRVATCGVLMANMACAQAQDNTLWGPDLMMAGGLALLIAPALWSNDPVSQEQKVQLARDAVARAQPARGPVSWNVAAAPLAGGRGGEFSVAGRF